MQDIEYWTVKSLANPLLPNMRIPRLADINGPGYGWRNRKIGKYGVEGTVRIDHHFTCFHLKCDIHR